MIADKLDTLQRDNQKAATSAAKHNHVYIGTEHLLYGILKESTLLKSQKGYSKITNQLDNFLRSSAQFHDLDRFAKSGFASSKPILPRHRKEKGRKRNAGAIPALSFFAKNWSKSQRRQAPAGFGRKRNSKNDKRPVEKNKNNPLLIGEAGVGKPPLFTASPKIASGEITPFLRDKNILS